MSPRGPAPGLGGHAPHAGCAFEPRSSIVDEVVADVGGAIVIAIDAARSRARLAGEAHGVAGYLDLGLIAVPRDALDDVPVLVARREIHPPVEPARVGAQCRLDPARRLDELAPVHRSEEPQAADRVADRDLCGGLHLGFGMHQLLDRVARLGEALLDPRQRQRQGCALSLQPARQLGDERAHHRRIRARHVRDHQDEALGVAIGDVEHLVRPAVRVAAVDRRGRDARSHAAQVLDQREAQHDRDRPQLPEREGAHRLVGRHEARECLRVDASVAVRDCLEREVVDARQPRRGPACEARQLAAVALGQVPPRRADLLVDQVEIVEQPFRGGRDAAVRRDGRGQEVANLDQDAFVVG